MKLLIAWIVAYGLCVTPHPNIWNFTIRADQIPYYRLPLLEAIAGDAGGRFNHRFHILVSPLFDPLYEVHRRVDPKFFRSPASR